MGEKLTANRAVCYGLFFLLVILGGVAWASAAHSTINEGSGISVGLAGTIGAAAVMGAWWLRGKIADHEFRIKALEERKR